tara:strand:+ start:130 stop:1611 length:1482 start_codon:yes stop_codon:yes gene_type:complete
MPLTRIKTKGLGSSVTFENITDTGTAGTKVATGTTAQRGSSTGQWRYNSETGFFEGRNSNGSFSTLEPSPTVSSVDDDEVDSAAGGDQTIVITGTNFTSGSVVSFVGTSAEFNATTTTVNSATQITAVAPKASFLNAQEPYKVKVTSASGLSGTSSAGLINVDNAPTWTTSAGSLGSIGESDTGNHFTVVASDAEGDTISYSLQSGSLAGLSLNSSTGVISGDPDDVSGDTTNNFTLRATAGSKTADRSFSYITLNNPLSGLTQRFNSDNYAVSSFSSNNDVTEITNTSTIASVTGNSNYVHTRLYQTADGANAANWGNVVNTFPTSGGLTLTWWGKTTHRNNSTAMRIYDLYNRMSEYNNFNTNGYEVDWGYANGSSNRPNMRTMTGNSSWTTDDWHFYAARYEKGIHTSSTQEFKFTVDNAGSLYTHTANNGAVIGSNSNNSGFHGYSPHDSQGVNTYNWEGYTGGWKIYDGYLSDSDISYIYNNGNGRLG